MKEDIGDVSAQIIKLEVHGAKRKRNEQGRIRIYESD